MIPKDAPIYLRANTDKLKIGDTIDCSTAPLLWSLAPAAVNAHEAAAQSGKRVELHTTRGFIAAVLHEYNTSKGRKPEAPIAPTDATNVTLFRDKAIIEDSDDIRFKYVIVETNQPAP